MQSEAGVLFASERLAMQSEADVLFASEGLAMQSEADVLAASEGLCVESEADVLFANEGLGVSLKPTFCLPMKGIVACSLLLVFACSKRLEVIPGSVGGAGVGSVGSGLGVAGAVAKAVGSGGAQGGAGGVGALPGCQNPDARCPVTLEACTCASSASLSAVGCGPMSGYPYAAVTPDGATLAVDFWRPGSASKEAFRWTAATGSVRLPGGHVTGMSSDGSKILLATTDATGKAGLWQRGSIVEVPSSPLGLSEDGSRVLAWKPMEAARIWSQAGEVRIGDMNTRELIHWPTRMTPDGAIVVGSRLTPQADSVFRWTKGAFKVLGPRPSNALGAQAMAVSRDGSVVAGFTYAKPNAFNRQLELFHWTSRAGLRVVAPALSSAFSFELWLNDTGTVLVGTLGAAAGATSARAFRWTAETGAVVLDASGQSITRGTSADGSVVVGYTIGEQPFDLEKGYPAFVWTTARGLRSLKAALTTAGVALDGWELQQPMALSKNGKVVVGQGTCGGLPAVYRATLPD